MGRCCFTCTRAKVTRDTVKRNNGNDAEKAIETETQKVWNDNEIVEEFHKDFVSEIHKFSITSTVDSTRNELKPLLV